MTTQIPENVLIPDKVKTRLGTLNFLMAYLQLKLPKSSGIIRIFRVL